MQPTTPVKLAVGTYDERAIVLLVSRAVGVRLRF